MHTIFQRLKTFVSVHWVNLTLVAIVLLIGACSIRPGQYLIGWDVTAPELNPGLNLQRSFFGIWQTYRGLGTLDGMAHTANIIHILWIIVWKSIVGLQLARPTWLLILFALGMTGAATLTQKLILPLTTRIQKNLVNSAALIAGLFYGLNLYTLQMFYAPLEVFAYQFAVLPWLLWAALSYLQRKNIRALALFGLIALLGVGQAHVPTVFISTSLFLFLMLGVHILSAKKQLRSALVVLAVYIAVNCFWMLPYGYSALFKPAVISQSQINMLSTPEITARNQAWGTLARVVTLGSFNLDYLDWEKTTLKMQYMMPEWREHYFSIWYQVVTVVLFAFALIGSVLMVKNERTTNRSLLWVPISFALFFALLATDSLLFGWVTKLLTLILPLFGELFRFTFTKFSQPFALSFSLSLAFACFYALRWVVAKGYPILQKVLIAVLLLFMLIHSAPIWKNGLFYQNIWVTIPNEYFAAATYLNDNAQDWEKVAILPSPTLYGWTSNAWGYRGSGFLWQMTRPALLDRAFDAWSSENETYYQQLDTAVGSQDKSTFFQVLATYQASFVLYDSSFNTGTSQLQLTENQTVKNWLTQSATPVFQEGSLTIFALENSPSSAFAAINTPFLVSGSNTKTQTLAVPSPNFEMIDKTGGRSTFYPFLYLDRENLTDEPIEYANTIVTLPIPSTVKEGELVLPQPDTGTLMTLPFTVTREDNELRFTSQTIGMVEYANGQSVPINQPLTFSHQLDTDAQTVMADVNGQLLTLFTADQPTVWLSRLRMDQSVTIRTFLPEQTNAKAEVLEVSGQVDETIIPSSIWNTVQAIRIPTSQDQLIKSLKIRTYSKTVPLENGAPVENCDTLARGSVSESRANNQVIIVASGLANACKGFPLAPASSHDSFFVEIIGSTDAQNGLLAGIQSWSQPRSSVYQLLPKDASRLLLSVPASEKLLEKNVSLIFENRSFLKSENTATIERISVIKPAFSVDYLKHITIFSQDSATPTIAGVIPQSAQVSPTQFSATFDLQNTDAGLVFLQSFDHGWMAFPSLQPWKAFSHVKFNGWANAWLVPATLDEDVESVRITILYWPQLITTAGYGILVLTACGLGWLTWKERKTGSMVSDKLSKLRIQLRQQLDR